MTCVYSDNFFNLTLYLDLLLVAGSHPAKDETSLLIVFIKAFFRKSPKKILIYFLGLDVAVANCNHAGQQWQW